MNLKLKQLVAILFVGFLAACLPPPSTSPAYGPSPAYEPAPAPTAYAEPSYGTGVYVNGAEISATDKAQLEQLLGAIVPPGRYFILANGDAGVEGQAVSVNLVDLSRAGGAQQQQQQQQTQRGGGQTEIFSRGADGQQSSMVSDGDCILVSSPGVDFASSGC